MASLLLPVIYLAFISLGLPDSLLGSAWPSMYTELGASLSWAGIVSMIISVGTIVSALCSERLNLRLGTGGVTFLSVMLTAVALLGFSLSTSFWQLCLWAVPYGLGAGSVDAALNNYVALHYSSRHMSWLHCFWGVGASAGPYIMGYALSAGQGWPMGYRYIAYLQIALTLVLFLSLPLWKKTSGGQAADPASGAPALTMRQLISLPGAKAIMLAFMCYQAVENTTGLWASSYLVLHRGLTEAEAAHYAGLFYIGITAGRAVAGFITMKLSDRNMIRLGQAIILLGIVLLLAGPGEASALCGLMLVGLGCAPIYPSIIHSTPEHFGAERSQAMIGLEMASAYVGTTLLPPVFGLIANHISASLLPVYMLVFLCLMFIGHETVLKRCRAA